jgi:dTDP-4-amino-4,6-dideoxy-D-galactose acyltransferase
MIKELAWDSNFFKKKIGELHITRKSLSDIEPALNKAKEEGFEYITCKINSHPIDLIKYLESIGFYLSDIGVTFSIVTENLSYSNKYAGLSMVKPITVATEKDIPILKEMTNTLFEESRFYNDPFFSKEEAKKLYQAWIENSVKGEIADKVFYACGEGFIVCKKQASDEGTITLIGIKKDFRGKGLGTRLIKEAIIWFKAHRINIISIRTQLRNTNAMNFYARMGFSIKGYDMVLGKIL